MNNTSTSRKDVSSKQEASAAAEQDQRPAPEVTDKVTRKAHSLIDSASKKAARVEENVRANAEDAHAQLDAKREATAETLHDSMDSVEDFVRRKPLAAAGIAFAAGIFASRLLRS
jgi:ElaB/YqjD/DUF883 family membrane-anchored ribosome-binding protein